MPKYLPIVSVPTEDDLRLDRLDRELAATRHACGRCRTPFGVSVLPCPNDPQKWAANAPGSILTHENGSRVLGGTGVPSATRQTGADSSSNIQSIGRGSFQDGEESITTIARLQDQIDMMGEDDDE